MSVVQEILGATNYWLDRRGNATAVRNHLEWACRHLRMPEPDPMDDRSQRRVLYAMFDRGFIRVAIQGSRVNVEYRSINEDQLTWLRGQADDREGYVVGDDGSIIYRSPSHESLPQRVMSVLLSEDTGVA